MRTSSLLRGLVQIRTGVNGFADRYLTTRPRDLDFDAAKIHFFLKCNFFTEKFVSLLTAKKLHCLYLVCHTENDYLLG